jgi:hypothetical protein
MSWEEAMVHLSEVQRDFVNGDAASRSHSFGLKKDLLLFEEPNAAYAR